MNDRITVHIAEETTRAELQTVAREVASSFDMSLPEAEALLKADVIVLERGAAEALVAICQRLGIRGKMTKPKASASRGARLRHQTLPWLLALLGTVALVALVSLVLPEVSVSSDAAMSDAAMSDAGMSDAAMPEANVADPLPSLPVVAAETAAEPLIESSPESDATDAAVGNVTDNATDDAASDAVPRIASATVPVEAVVAEAAPSVTTEVPTAAPEPAAPDLFTAARDLGVADLERALTAAPGVDVQDAYGQTPLMYAAGSNADAVVRTLLAAGADVNAASDAGWTPLMYAARNTNHPGVAQILLAAGADAAALNESGQGARDIALAYNNSAAEVIPVAAQSRAQENPAVGSRAEEPQNGLRQRTAPSLTIRPIATPVAPAPSVGGGTPLHVTPRPLPSVPLPVPDQSAGAQAVPPAVQDEQRSIILDCLQNWDNCGN